MKTADNHHGMDSNTPLNKHKSKRNSAMSWLTKHMPPLNQLDVPEAIASLRRFLEAQSLLEISPVASNYSSTCTSPTLSTCSWQEESFLDAIQILFAELATPTLFLPGTDLRPCITLTLQAIFLGHPERKGADSRSVSTAHLTY